MRSTVVKPDKNWISVKESLKGFLDDTPQYYTWIARLKFIRFDKADGALFLEAPSGRIRDVLESRYQVLIREKSSDVFGGVNEVVFLLPEEVADMKSDGKKPSEEALSDMYPDDIMMNPRYVFETFIVGPNNHFAHSAAMQVAKSARAPKTSLNPLFIYGGSGLGKTHLMCAIGHYIINNYPNLRVLYVSSETFTSDYVDANINYKTRTEKMKAFRNKYRKVDVLMIDDIQFIEGKEKTVEEVFNTYNTLYNMGKQLIFSSDRPPKDLLETDERLRSRLSVGLQVDIQPPSFEIKVAILLNMANTENIPLTDGLKEVIDIIADRIKTNIRDLEGAFHRVVVFSTFSEEPITKSLARKVLSDLFTINDAMPAPETIKKNVAKYYEIKPADLDSSKRSRQFSFPRQIAMYLCREMTILSLSQIGEKFGKKDHTTVLHACQKIEKERLSNENLSSIIAELEDMIRNN